MRPRVAGLSTPLYGHAGNGGGALSRQCRPPPTNERWRHRGAKQTPATHSPQPAQECKTIGPKYLFKPFSPSNVVGGEELSPYLVDHTLVPLGECVAQASGFVVLPVGSSGPCGRRSVVYAHDYACRARVANYRIGALVYKSIGV